MYIFELVKPGSRIKSEDREFAWKFESLLRHLETAFYDANISLNFLSMKETLNRIAMLYHTNSGQVISRDDKS